MTAHSDFLPSEERAAVAHAGALVPDLLIASAPRHADATAIDVDGRMLTYSQLSDRASRLAAALRDRRVASGRRVGVLAMNDLEYVEIRIAAQRAGAILVPLNFRLAGSELATIVEDADLDLLIVGRELEDMAADLPAGEHLHLGDGSYEREIAAHQPEPIPVGYEPEAIREICYTSGTTARPKGVMLSNRAIHANLVAVGQEMAAHPGMVFLLCSPLFHVASHVALSATYFGGSVVQLRRFEVDACLAAIDRTSPTHTLMAPTMLQMLLDAWDCRRPTLKRIMYGGAPMPLPLLERVMSTFGSEMVGGYGSTEAMAISLLMPEEHVPARLASVGRGSFVTTTRIVDETGNDVGPGEVGEVIARGPTLMSGYWGNQEATSEALRDGWMHTGDMGFRDDDGYLHLVDRRNDKIVTGGENVYPSEVEAVLSGYPDVAEAAVIGAPHELWGEAVTAVVVPRPGAAIDTTALERHCRQALARYKVPKRVVVATEPLPRNAAGKLLRRQIRSDIAL